MPPLQPVIAIQKRHFSHTQRHTLHHSHTINASMHTNAHICIHIYRHTRKSSKQQTGPQRITLCSHANKGTKVKDLNKCWRQTAQFFPQAISQSSDFTLQRCEHIKQSKAPDSSSGGTNKKCENCNVVRTAVLIHQLPNWGGKKVLLERETSYTGILLLQWRKWYVPIHQWQRPMWKV